MAVNEVAVGSFDVSSGDVSPQTPLTNSTSEYVWVLDPLTRKLRVPVALLRLSAASNTPGTVPSLCMAFLEGSCANVRCRHVHIPAEVVAQLRMEASVAPSCCYLHREPHELHSLLGGKFSTFIVQTGAAPDARDIGPQPVERLALTVGLQRYVTHEHPPPMRPGSSLLVPLKLICRLHLASRCRFQEDCKYIHICRELGAQIFINGPGGTSPLATSADLRGSFGANTSPLCPAIAPVMSSQDTAKLSAIGYTTSSLLLSGVEYDVCPILDPSVTTNHLTPGRQAAGMRDFLAARYPNVPIVVIGPAMPPMPLPPPMSSTATPPYHPAQPSHSVTPAWLPPAESPASTPGHTPFVTPTRNEKPDELKPHIGKNKSPPAPVG